MGGYPGLFEMVGNVDEWIDTCDSVTNGVDGGSDNCYRRSGSFENPNGDQQTCTFNRVAPRSAADKDMGVRCCSSLK